MRKKFTHTESAKRKIAESRKGKKHSIETKEKMSKSKKGRHLSVKTEFKKGFNASPETQFGGLRENKRGERKKWKKGVYLGNGKANWLKPGKDHPNWKDGRSFEPYSLDWTKELKTIIRKRDNHTCQECKCKQEQLGYALDVHHIDYNKKNCNHDNLISLCRSCHIKTNYKREEWQNHFNRIFLSDHLRLEVEQ